MLQLSVIILSYNTKKITENCLTSLFHCLESSKISYEIIVVDNGSTDGSVEQIKNLKFKIKNLRLIKNSKNLGFAIANNQALKTAKGEYILFLNSDVIINKVDFSKLLDYLDKQPDVGALTVKVKLTTGDIDPASHRGFPTIWNSICYFFKLEKLFGNLPLIGGFFGGYHLSYLDLDTVHEIDSPSGAFYLTRKEPMDKTGGFDEDYFMYGEDIDLSFRIRKLGYKILYYPLYQVTHLKYSSGLKKNDGEVKEHFYNAMKIFYHKHYQADYPYFINKLVYFFIDLKNKLS